MQSTSFIPTITPQMTVASIAALAPSMSEIMAEYGLHCFSCHMGGRESLAEGVAMHGFTEDMLQTLVEDLQDELNTMSQKSQDIQITVEAAQALYAISQQEGHTVHAIHIIADDFGGFCMEYRDVKDSDDQEIVVEEVPDMHFYVSPATLWHLGGSTIEYTNGKFSLIKPDVTTQCCGNSADSHCHCNS